MEILSASQFRDWDRYTMLHEPVTPVDLMERAALACADWIRSKPWKEHSFCFFCGRGNNGGDGLAIARLLYGDGYRVAIHVLKKEGKNSGEWETNLKRLTAPVHFLETAVDFPAVPPDAIVVDALFGSGLNRPLEGTAAALVFHLNASAWKIISIDLPSGLQADRSSKDDAVIKATHTLTFQALKTALLLQENAPFIGTVTVLPIGLHPGYPGTIRTNGTLVEIPLILSLFRRRDAFAHKGSFGHALLIAGSFGKMGAAILAAKACVHSGCGLLSCCIPGCGYSILQTALPEAMALVDEDEKLLTQLPEDPGKYAAIGLGPGIGTGEKTQKLVSGILQAYRRPLVIDADALNILSIKKEGLKDLPPQSILTPHPKEFDRLFGDHANDFDRTATAIRQSAVLQAIIVLKSHHTLIVAPDGQVFFNSTGNAGMAKGGSGDVLTGILTSLLAQGYAPLPAALLGVYLHGLAGDLAAAAHSQEAMTPSDLVQALGAAFLQLNQSL